MTFNTKKLPSPKSNKPRPPPMGAGSYPARLVQLVIIGVQKQRAFKGEEKSPRLMARLTYEMADEFMKDEEGNDIEDKPRWLSEEIAFMSLKQDLATSTKRYYAFDPDDEADGDWLQLIGKPCMVVIVNEKDKRPGYDVVYEKIAGVSALRAKEAAKLPPLKNPTTAFDFYNPDMEAFEKFPDWIQDKIKAAVDFEGSALAQALGESTGAPVKPVADKGSSKESKASVEQENDAGEGEDW